MADVMELIKQHEADMIGIRRHIHANPELSNEENRTTALIREKLEEYGIEIMEIGLKTGVVGFLKGGRPGKTVAIREDIDALPMSEKTGLPYASSVDGVCHSCGHDIHTTVLLFCARVLSELRDQLSGNVLFLFQPAEERGTGARQLLDCKFYEPVKPDVLVGLHVSPEYPAGSIGLKEGPANASCDTFYIKVSGKGGHGAHPENCIDPIAISGYIMAQLQTVVSRENHPVYPAVMTIGSIHGGKAPNVIPDFVEDIDALPMSEKTGLPYASSVDGVCHSCGHDIHTTVLLFCARVLSELRDQLSGNVLFLFQPAEERGTGARQLLDCKFYEPVKPDVLVGLHVSPEYPAGSIGLKEGPANASCDTFYIKVSGKGGHGAHPENCIDPIAISGYIMAQLQTVVSRENHPVYPAVMTIGSIHGGKAPNVIPDFVEMSGTLRSLNAESREKMQAAIDRICISCAEAMRGSAEIRWEKGMPPLVNDRNVIEGLRTAAEKTIGADHVITVQNPSLGSEDFSFLFPLLAPGAQFRLGSGNDVDPNTRHGLHNSKNIFDDSCIAAGTAVLVQYTKDFLK